MTDVPRLQRAVQEGDQAALALAKETPDGLSEARARSKRFSTPAKRSSRRPRERIVLGGFSQGAMLACDVTLRAERPPAGLVAMSGAPICEPEWRALARNARACGRS